MSMSGRYQPVPPRTLTDATRIGACEFLSFLLHLTEPGVRRLHLISQHSLFRSRPVVGPDLSPFRAIFNYIYDGLIEVHYKPKNSDRILFVLHLLRCEMGAGTYQNARG
jgi:hypothetical protein